MRSLRAEARCRGGERGTSVPEAAVVTPLFFLLVFGAIEGGYGLHERLSVTNMALAGARSASGNGADLLADHLVLQAVEGGAGGVASSQVSAIVVYKASGPGTTVPTACKTVEAGCGFDAALSIVCQHFDSPMADELRLALQGMELGMPRREVLQELKRRTDLDVVRTFAVALIQADGLGIPMGRVLTTQATEIRSRRRAWAREKAAKLPVKIMFPMVLFIFPPIMAIVIAPAFTSFSGLK